MAEQTKKRMNDIDATKRRLEELITELEKALKVFETSEASKELKEYIKKKTKK